MNASLEKKYDELKKYIQSLGSVAVAFSGGVDSTLLLKVAVDVLGTQKVMAITATADYFPKRETKEAESFCKSLDVKQQFVAVEWHKIDGFEANPVDRCYICKKAIFTKVMELATANGMNAVAEGSNIDDDGDYRPGHIAIRELGVKSPLRVAGLCKAEIRELLAHLGIPVWSKPSFACLASRFAYGEKITKEKLSMVERAEQLLIDLGFEQMRVRIHGDKDYIARIEVPSDEIDRLMERDTREKIYNTLKEYGFSYVSVDMMGYRQGGMNMVIPADILAKGITREG